MPPYHPPHIYLNSMWYMITAATVHHAPLLTGDAAKLCLRDALQRLAPEHNIILRAWVILDDHYHLLLRTGQGRLLPRFFGQLHGSTARQVNLLNGTVGRKVWQNYWDTCLRTDGDVWTRFNYIHLNPVKHGYVSRPQDWLFSSYPFYWRTKGEQWLGHCWSRYPVADFFDVDDFGGVREDGASAVTP